MGQKGLNRALIITFFVAVQNMLQTTTVVSAAKDMATGPETAESPQIIGCPPTEAVTILQAAPHLLEPEQEDNKIHLPNDGPINEMADYLVEMFESCTYWGRVPTSMKPNTRTLVNELMNSKAQSTVQRYAKEVIKFSKWCHLFQPKLVPPYPVPLLVAYLSRIYDQNKSYASLVLTHAALKWFHSLLPYCMINPLDTSLCHNLLETARRKKSPVKKKVPLSADILKEILDKYDTPSANLKDLRLACMCSLGFTGFFRYDELSSISLTHLEFSQDHLKIFIPRAKNDAYREGNYVYIKRIDNRYCPVSLVQRYISLAGLNLKDNESLFRPLRFLKSKNRYVFYGNKLSYTRCRELFKDCIKELGYNEKLYGLHSLRSGGATAAVANNQNLSERLLKLHGRWKSDYAKDMYILESVQNRLQISSQLGI